MDDDLGVLANAIFYLEIDGRQKKQIVRLMRRIDCEETCNLFLFFFLRYIVNVQFIFLLLLYFPSPPPLLSNFTGIFILLLFTKTAK